MELRRLLRAAIFATLAMVVGFGGGWAWVNRQRNAQAEFDQKRLELLQAENDRLRELVAAAEGAKKRAAQAARRTEIEQTTARIRGLAFKQPVTYDILTREGIKKLLRQKLSEQYSDADFEKARLGYVALGLLPPDYPLKQRYLDLLGEQVAAFYDQHTHRLFMFEDASLDSPQNCVILSHELTHALQDQHFGIKNLPLEVKDNDDLALATSSLIEGDATLEMNEYSAGTISWKVLREDMTGLFTQSLDQIEAAPRILRESLLFPYTYGLEYCTQLFQQHGFAGISSAFLRPPASTAQIMHPEKYLANERPVTVAWSDTTALGEPALADNVLGEFGTRILLAEGTDEATADAVAPGWRGDRYLVFDHGKALVWRTVWSGPEAATRFIEAEKRVLARRYKAEPMPGESSSGAILDFKAPGRVIKLIPMAQSTQTILIDAADERWAKALADKFAH